MKIDLVEFVVSAARSADYPREPLPELALVGRSNVGKSSLINALVGRAVARTSGTPGKTRLVNFFRVRPVKGGPFYLVDLPGFGYTDARAGREAFEAVTRAYFESRALACVLLLVDSRHPGLPIDLAADEWLRSLGVRYLVVATKFDKLPRSRRLNALGALEQAFQGHVLPVSAATGENLDQLWSTIRPCLNPTPPR